MPKAIKVFSKGSVVAERYRVLGRLGQGGMGVVYKALDCKLNNHVVIKVPLLHLLQEKLFAERFQKELQSLISLSHPGIVRVLDLGEIQGVPYAVFPFLPGKDLNATRPKDSMGNYQPVNIRSVLAWLPQVANALDYVHRNGIIHRDIKPANILFDAERNPFVSDFGIAKILSDSSAAQANLARTQTGVVLGTPDYTAPELILGDVPTPKADIFSLAMTIYELSTGRVPYSDLTPAAVLVKQATEQVPTPNVFNPQLTSQVSQAILQGLAKSAEERPATCSEFCDFLTAAITGNSRSNSSTRHEPTTVAHDHETQANQLSTLIQLQTKFANSINWNAKNRNLRRKKRQTASGLLVSLLSWVFVCAMVIAITYIAIFKLKLFGEPPGGTQQSTEPIANQRPLTSKLKSPSGSTNINEPKSSSNELESEPRSNDQEKLKTKLIEDTPAKIPAQSTENAKSELTNLLPPPAKPFENLLPPQPLDPESELKRLLSSTNPINSATRLVQEGKTEEYIRTLRELAKDKQHSSRANFILAIGYALTRQSKESKNDDLKAEAYFERCLDSLSEEVNDKQTNSAVNLSSTKNNLGIIRLRQGKPEVGLKLWIEALENAGPNESEILSNIVTLKELTKIAARVNASSIKSASEKLLFDIEEVLKGKEALLSNLNTPNRRGWQFTTFVLEDNTSDPVIAFTGLNLLDSSYRGGVGWLGFNMLQPGSSLKIGESLTSPNGQIQLIFQGDGNLVLYRNPGMFPAWNSGTIKKDSAECLMLKNGNFVIVNKQGIPIWATSTDGNPGAVLAVQDDATLALYKDERVVWVNGVKK